MSDMDCMVLAMVYLVGTCDTTEAVCGYRLQRRWHTPDRTAPSCLRLDLSSCDQPRLAGNRLACLLLALDAISQSVKEVTWGLDCIVNPRVSSSEAAFAYDNAALVPALDKRERPPTEGGTGNFVLYLQVSDYIWVVELL